MPELPFETRTLEQLTPLTALSPDALTAVQEPGGPVGRVSIKQLLGRLVQTDTAKETRADLLADLDHDEPAVALVFADPDPALNGWYRKTGASGAGTWTQFEKLSAFAAAEIAGYVAQASDAADAADSAAMSAQALTNYRKTRAEGVADFPVGAQFSSDETGQLRLYDRIVGAPFYSDLGDSVAPVSRKLLGTVGPTLIGVGPNGRTLEHNIAERHNVRDFGAFGDNVERPLSDFYASLAAAQAEFPAATSLTNLIDGLAINKALKVVAESAHGRGVVYVPAGRYRGNTGSLLLPQFCTLEGDGAGQSIIDNQNTPVAYPLVTNRDLAGVLFTTVRGLSFHGGTVGMDFSAGGEVTGMAFDDISFALQTEANMKVGNYLQTSTFYRVGFGGDALGYTRGLWQTGSIANANTFDDCEFTSHRLEHLWLNSPENVRIRGGRFEAAGQPEANITGSITATTLTVTAVANGFLRAGTLLVGANILENTVIMNQLTGTAGGTGTYSVNRSQTAASAAIKGYTPTIRLHHARSVEIGTYMEATHEFALVETDSLSGVRFAGSHFTGAYVSDAFIPYKFDSLGVIEFGSNSAYKAFPGPRRMLVTGNTISTESGLPCLVNPDADIWHFKNDRGGKGSRRKVNFAASANFSLITFSRSSDSGGQMVEGVVSVMMAAATVGGGLPVDKIVRIPFAVAFRQGYVAELGVTTAQVPYDPSSGYTIALAAIDASNTALTIQVQCSGANGAGQSYAVASIDFTNSSDGNVSLLAEFA